MNPLLLRATTIAWLTPLLLVCSNICMTFAWYWYLKFKNLPLWQVVFISWSIALLEYWLVVPANRWGNSVYSPVQLKAMQELITLSVFTIFSATYLGDQLRWTQGLGFALLVVAAWLLFDK